MNLYTLSNLTGLLFIISRQVSVGQGPGRDLTGSPALGLTRPQSRGSHPKLEVLSQAHEAFGRIHFFPAIELMEAYLAKILLLCDSGFRKGLNVLPRSYLVRSRIIF